jgi:hypothetical protein
MRTALESGIVLFDFSVSLGVLLPGFVREETTEQAETLVEELLENCKILQKASCFL